MTDIAPPRSRTRAGARDISPKQAASQKKAQKSGAGAVFGLAKAGIVLLAIFVLAGAGAAHVLFSKGTVSLWPVARSLALQETVKVQAGADSVDFEAKLIPAKLIEQEKTITKLYPATGTKTLETKAKGVIRVTNNQQKTQILVAATRFISENGKLFRSTQRVSIPAGSSLDVSVEAAESGSEYNISPSNFSLPGLAGSSLYTLVYGKSSKDMAGGSKSSMPVVTDQDIRNAKQDVEQQASDLAQQEILRRSIMPFVVDERSLDARVVDSFSSIQPGAELAQFNATAKVHAQALMFHMDDLRSFVQDIFQDELAERERLHVEGMSVTYTAKQFHKESMTLDMEVQAQAKAYQDIDIDQVKSGIQGQKRRDAEAFLSSLPVVRFQIDLWPAWRFSLPKDIRQVTVSLMLD
ncbi:MAG: baseplate J/gp47 family protein [Candidatus Wildermuthbacteria bacterium]|nr:baseplate J/gp47 family protein [Candidatus Wildermuthbacteria bacterium]